MAAVAGALNLNSSLPQHSEHLSQDWDLPALLPERRAARALPYELRQHCIIYLEERLYSQALALLTSLVVSGNSSTLSHTLATGPADLPPAYIPSPKILALLSTLIVHPSKTTQSGSDDTQDDADQALGFLLQLNDIVGPINANFSSAFQLSGRGRASGYRRNGGVIRRSSASPVKRESEAASRLTSRSASPEDDRDGGNDNLSTWLAKDGSLWVCAADFWHIVGWSFNCAARWRQRWRRWKLLLQLLLRILEDDWVERSFRSRNDRGDEDTTVHASASVLHESLIVQYLTESVGGGTGPIRRLMRSILANGSDKDVIEFGQIFPRETVAKKQEDDPLRFKIDQQVNIDEGEFGDYFEQEDEDGFSGEAGAEQEPDSPGGSSSRLSRSSNRQRSRPISTTSSTKVEPQDADKDIFYGGHEAAQLRRRILILLTKVASALPNQFVTLDSLLDVLEEYLRPLPLPIYVALVSPTAVAQQYRNDSSWSSGRGGPSLSFPPSTHISLLQELARALLPPAAPRIRDNYLTQGVLLANYLPYPAGSGSAVDNAKMSVVLEGMVRLLKRYVGIDGAGGKLRQAVEKGITARMSRVQEGPSKARKGPEELEGLEWLRTSGARLRWLVDVIEAGE